MTVVTNKEDKDGYTLQTEASVSSGDNGSKRRRKSVRENNIEQVIDNHKKIEREAKFNASLKKAFELLDYASEIK